MKVFSLVLYLGLLERIHGQDPCSSDGEVRLVGGRHLREGRLELCSGGSWGTVCNENWDISDAVVVCRQLDPVGFDLNAITVDLYFSGASTSQSVHISNVNCSGNENRLTECSSMAVVGGSCGHDQDVGLICAQPEVVCNDGDVRLVGGPTSDEGRVEYCVGGLWGTVCDEAWDTADVAVVCEQLGFPSFDDLTSDRRLKTVPTINASERPIVLTSLMCNGNESQLSQCNQSVSISQCDHTRDAGARCKCPTANALRLVGGVTENIGRVEYCQNGDWFVFCQDPFTLDNAQVVCRQLGFQPIANLTPSISNNENFNMQPLLDRGILSTIFHYSLNCNGTESFLSECNSEPIQFCFPIGVGVVCPVKNDSECEANDIRLVNGIISTQNGRVEVCVNGRWGLVCTNNWNNADSRVVCRQLGYGGGVAVNELSVYNTNESLEIFLDDLRCVGTEPNLFQCEHPGVTIVDPMSCHPSVSAAGIICGTTVDRCPAGRINSTVVPSPNVDYTIPTFGRCEPYRHQSMVCDDFISDNNYVFNPNSNINQAEIGRRLQGILIASLLDREGAFCRESISTIVCNYFFAPCGNQDGIYPPLSICRDECSFVSRVCSATWTNIQDLLANTDSLYAINCSDTASRYKGLSSCCSGFDIRTVVEPPVPTDNGSTDNGSTDNGSTDNQKDSITDKLVWPLAAAVAFIAITLCVVFLVLILLRVGMTSVKRKQVVKEIQMEVLSNPANPAVANGESHEQTTPQKKLMKGPSMAEFKKRNGSQIGSRKYSSVPNPYSSFTNPEQEIDFSAPLLNTTFNKQNRISSSMIRELSTDMLIPYCRLNLMDCIGQGEFGVVYRAEYYQPNDEEEYETFTVAVKTLKGFFDSGKISQIMDESLKMKHFDHPNVLGLFGVCLDAGPAPYVVMPFMANGSLLHYLKKERSNIVLSTEVDDDVKVDVRKRLTIMCLQIANGMDYLAEEKFVHRDLAARNCMIDLHFVIKIADFGLTEDVYSKNYFRQGEKTDSSIKLPVKWMAPESLNDGVFSEKTDVWSFGVTCWEIFSGGKTPYPGVDPLMISQMLDSGQRLQRPLNSACSDENYSLMMKCWSTNPIERPSFKDVAKTLSGYTETIAGYLDINSSNPFTTSGDQKPLQEDGFNNDILTRPDKIAALFDQPKTKKSPRSSPRASPHASPLPSPMSNLNKLPQSAGITICIDPGSPPK